jgi:hypothetical protein
MSKIDVEQAINLLQQLRKTASPAELVSLHKALLPTTDVSPVPPPQLSSIEEHTAFSALSGRTCAARPPGLATRGSFLGDPLRSQEEEAAKTLKTKRSNEQHGAWFEETMSAFNARTATMTSTGTPLASSYSRTAGAFDHGTLRVTNGGAASPASSMVSKPAVDNEDGRDVSRLARKSEESLAPFSRERAQQTWQQQRRYSQDSADTRTTLTLAHRRQQQWARCTSRPIPSLTSVVPPKTQTPLAELPEEDHRQEPSRQDKESPNARSSFQGSAGAPRYEQRWNHRASHVSSESKPDCNTRSHLNTSNAQIHELPENNKRYTATE